MTMTKEYLSYDDIAIVPAVTTSIVHREECDPYRWTCYLPIFASCMDTVVSMENIGEFNKNGISVVIPRGIPFDQRFDYFAHNSGGYEHENFVAFSLDETERIFFDSDSMYREIIDRMIDIDRSYKSDKCPFRLCIDLANGHMKCLLDLVKKLRKEYSSKELLIMTGNIANPETYIEYEDAGVDFVRVGIGGGSGCLTSSNTGVHMPYYTLLNEMMQIKKSINGKCKIVADGNIRGYADIQKALTTADYVMIGSLFNKAMESAGKTTFGNFYWNISGKRILRPIKTLFNRGKEVPKGKYEEIYKDVKRGVVDVYKQFYGQSTKIAQKKSGNKVLKTAEGIVKYNKVEYDLAGWVKNEIDYLRSAMSYTNSKTLVDFQNAKVIKITQRRFNL